MTPLALSNIEHDLTESPIRRIATLLAQAKNDKSIISFGGGAPSLTPPKEVVDAIVSALKNNTFQSTSYGSTQGRLQLRELISKDLAKNKVKVSPENIKNAVE